jgi:DNA-binding NtrC family response regulator
MENDQVRVFVVDDQPIIASTLADILRLSGFSATSFTDPHEALRAARADAPDLVISDIEMPGLSGIELAIQLKEMQLGCNILLVSGHATGLDLLDEARELGYDFHVLAKPIGPRKLIAEIRGRGWGSRRAPSEASLSTPMRAVAS